ncbi:MAG: 30S ribosomal protein S4 [Candidatus Omnitrophica bacterium]|nr:30S ribosomal protein S4 [Candidatus Omnitrophota bacterium]
MARYLGTNCRFCRREGMKLFLKGTRCSSEKCAFAKRPTPPGMHTRQSSKQSYYAQQLREKQKAKRTYGLLEAQFKRFFHVASKAKGVTGRTLLQLLERRIDNVVYRALFAFSRDQARQMVRHGFLFSVKGRVDIPSYLVKEGEVFAIKANDNVKKNIKSSIEAISKERSVPSWLDVDTENLKIKVVRLPEKEDLTISINEQLIVELYSK